MVRNKRGLFLLAENQTVVCILVFFVVVVASFVNCILFHDEQKLFAIFCNQVVFLVFLFLFLLSFVMCKLYILWYAEDKSLFSLPEVEVLDRTQGLFS